MRGRNERTLEELLELFARRRTESLARIRALSLSAADLERRGLHPELGSVTLGQLLATWVVHDLAHLAQIARVLAKARADEIGPWRAYFRVLSSALTSPSGRERGATWRSGRSARGVSAGIGRRAGAVAPSRSRQRLPPGSSARLRKCSKEASAVRSRARPRARAAELQLLRSVAAGFLEARVRARIPRNVAQLRGVGGGNRADPACSSSPRSPADASRRRVSPPGLVARVGRSAVAASRHGGFVRWVGPRPSAGAETAWGGSTRPEAQSIRTARRLPGAGSRVQRRVRVA
jgi:hypothetical protein